MSAASLGFFMAPLGPLGAFVLLASGGARRPRAARLVALGGAGWATAGSAFGLAAALGGAHATATLPWLRLGTLRFDWTFALDPLSALAASVVSGLSCVVLAYAARTESAEAGVGRLLTWLSLFSGAMLVFVLSLDLVTAFVAWELLGFCSWVLIAHHHEDAEARRAAGRAFLVTRLGDLSLLAGLLLLALPAGTARVEGIIAAAPGAPALGAALALVILGALSKSAQLPFTVWLPGAMKGPTPVSALLHSATMVAAGVLLLARLSPLLALAPRLSSGLAWTGALTGLFGGAVALAQRELKRALAYSTLSQLGFMMMSLGAGSVAGAVWLLVGHAVYKALLFLAAGQLLHAAGSDAFAALGGLRRRLPGTAIAFAAGVLPLAGLPITLALPPKDLAVSAAYRAGPGLFAVVLLGTVLTAAYATSLYVRVFEGRGPTDAAVQAPAAGQGPVYLLAAALPLVGMLQARLLGEPLSRFLGEPRGHGWISPLLALAAAAVGALLAVSWGLRRRDEALLALPARVARPLRAELGLEALWSGAAQLAIAACLALARFDARRIAAVPGRVGKAFTAAARALSAVDVRALEAGPERLGRAALRSARGVSAFDARAVDRGTLRFADAWLAAGQRLRPVQTGRVDNYLMMAAAWVAAAVVLAAAWGLWR